MAANLTTSSIIDYLKFPKDVVQEYTTSYKTYDFTIQKLSNDAIEELKGKIIPLLLTLVTTPLESLCGQSGLIS